MDKVEILFNEKISDDQIQYAVIVSRYEGRWVYVNHKERDTWEIPGGRLEVNEAPWDAAARELYEETGASDFILIDIGNYNVKVGEHSSYGALYYADIKEFDSLPDMEIEKVDCFDIPPSNQTYGHIQPLLHDYCTKYLRDEISETLLSEPFSFKRFKNGKLDIFYNGESVMILKDKKAEELYNRLEKATRYEEQLLMAKATKNFKRGNERQGKNSRK